MSTDSEFALIHRFFGSRQSARADVALGIGDDCAELRVPPDRRLAVTLDLLVAGTHFAAAASADSIGHKALAVNLSDLAAQGAEPAWVTLGLALPDSDTQWLHGFCEGFFALARQHDVALIGGDLTRGPLTIAIQAHGFVAASGGLQRSGAQPGDAVWVTGTLGDAGLALANASGRCRSGLPGAELDYLQQRLDRPTPRVAQGLDLHDMASSAIDVSDGLAQDLGHVLAASGVGARIRLPLLPLSAAAQRWRGDPPAVSAALSAGDDYELCFTVARERRSMLQRRAAHWPCQCTEIGTIEAEPGLRLEQADGTLYQPQQTGYQHFA